ncbi:MAG: flagellar biosynthetic protein FliR, partial [Blastocatellia bacterium]|nr:flagellar biosynthetic protein FliR [Blastocatellia bacterium]
MESTIFNIIDMILKALGIEQNPVAFIGLFGLIMARLVPAINYTPFFGGQTVNGRTKIALSVALSFLLYPAMVTVIPSEQIPTKFLTLVLLMIKEAVVGFT